VTAPIPTPTPRLKDCEIIECRERGPTVHCLALGEHVPLCGVHHLLVHPPGLAVPPNSLRLPTGLSVRNPHLLYRGR